MSEEAPSMTDLQPKPTVETQKPLAHKPLETERVRAKNFQRMVTSAERVRTLPGGERLFVRFSQFDILQHWILLINFTILAVTGLLEMFSNNRISADFIMPVFRDLDNLRGLHNVAAVFYVGMLVLHGLLSLTKWFIKNDPPLMIPARQDWQDFIHTWKYLLGRTFPRPEFGRFTIDQKVTYWMVGAFSTIMFFTSLAQWFQTWVAQYMTQAILPVSRSLHSLTGLLIVVTFLPWHIYHTVIKERNASIFTGVLDEKTIRHNHPLDYRQIMTDFNTYQHLNQQASPQEPLVIEPEALQTPQEIAPEKDIEPVDLAEKTADDANPAQP